MKNRNIHELLVLLHKHYKEGKLSSAWDFAIDATGLCWACDILELNKFINNKEFIILGNYITNNKPRKTKHFYWPAGYRKPRLAYLRYHINKTKTITDD